MKQNKTLVFVAVAVIVLAALSRVAFYSQEFYFSPAIAMALFSGSVIKDKKLAFIMPIFSMFLADFLFEVSGIAKGFWGWGQLLGYAILALVTVLGFYLKKINVINVAGFSIASTLIFFFLSNSSVWLFDSAGLYYPRTFEGYKTCLAAGIPFLKNSMIADLVYSTIFFGGFVLLEKYTAKTKAIA